HEQNAIGMLEAGAQLAVQLQQVLDQVFGPLVTVLGVLGHHASPAGGQLVGNLGVEVPGIGRAQVLMMAPFLEGRYCRHGGLAGLMSRCTTPREAAWSRPLAICSM